MAAYIVALPFPSSSPIFDQVALAVVDALMNEYAASTFFVGSNDQERSVIVRLVVDPKDLGLSEISNDTLTVIATDDADVIERWVGPIYREIARMVSLGSASLQ